MGNGLNSLNSSMETPETKPLMCRGVRGATTASGNTPEAIVEATRELLQTLIDLNGISEDEVASVIFTTSPDLTAAYPAQAARQCGWWQVALLGAQEIDIPDGLKLAVRILIHWNTTKGLGELKHVYMHGAERLRPDLYPKNKVVIDDADEAKSLTEQDEINPLNQLNEQD
jgi:chorismate mutase